MWGQKQGCGHHAKRAWIAARHEPEYIEMIEDEKCVFNTSTCANTHIVLHILLWCSGATITATVGGSQCWKNHWLLACATCPASRKGISRRRSSICAAETSHSGASCQPKRNWHRPNPYGPKATKLMQFLHKNAERSTTHHELSCRTHHLGSKASTSQSCKSQSVNTSRRSRSRCAEAGSTPETFGSFKIRAWEAVCNHKIVVCNISTDVLMECHLLPLILRETAQKE